MRYAFPRAGDIEMLRLFWPRQLWLKMLWGMVLGLAIGYALSPEGLALVTERAAGITADWVYVPGALFLGLIKMVVIPLVVCSIITGIAASDNLAYLRSSGWRIALYFVGTTAIAVALAFAIVNIVNPADYVSREALLAAERKPPPTAAAILAAPDLPKMMASVIPENPAQAVVESQMLQIVIGAVLMGIALLSLPKARARPVLDLCASLQDVAMKVVGWAMVIAPFAVFGLLCNMVIKTGFAAIAGLAAYVAAILAGLAALLCMYLLIVRFVAGRSPREFLRGIRDAQILAFSTSSSAATMPMTLHVAEKELKIRPEVFRFVIPLGTTVNMDGTALYQMTAALFLAKLFGIDLGAGQTVILAVTIIGASIGSPGSPSVGLVILSTILATLGVSPSGIALILAVDRILDMCRTTINVTGDLVACVVMEKWSKIQEKQALARA